MKKNKKKICTLIATVVLMSISASNVLASEVGTTKVEQTQEVNATVEPRSRYLATALSKVTNEGEGVLRIYADFTSYSDVQWAQITIKLESRKGTSGDWDLVDTYVYEFSPDDEPDGRLHSGEASFRVYGLPTNYYYRVRCTHKVQTPSGSYESKSTQTNGTLLTSYPAYRTADEVE